MEKLGLRTLATRASIIKTFKKRYVINSRKSLKPIKKSKKLVEKCNELPILNVKITSE
ncbi:MAG TPA: hypothetical protein ENF67_00835 [Candidatus Pacearchaeota archaeon]|nr:hypothetical protein [Candidatus Pacearchaeota archaeon]